ncbi:MAG: leucine-rich repeat domain-containing protein [Oscillospiraceae bacterium]|nr:leucine-rich repeat domain-containing protein [Oscillospiraceae bacterium]
MRCNFCGAEWSLPYKMTITECPFCRRPLATPGAGTRSSGYTPRPSETAKTTTSTANRREDFDIVGTVLRAYKGTNPVVYVPEGITELGMVKPGTGAFFKNKVIQKVVLPKSLRSISEHAFGSSSVREVVFSDGITHIPFGAFEHCTNLQKVHLPSSLIEIGPYAFWETALTEIIIPNGTKRILQAAFLDCYYLRRVLIPDSVEAIYVKSSSHCAPGVFCNCTALCDVTWPVNRFNPIIFKDSLYHDKVMADLRAAEAHRKAAAEAAEQKLKQDKKLIDEGICPKCKGKISFWTNRCKQCGTKF